MSATEREMLARLRARYQPPAFALFEHVRNSTGVSHVTRTADAMAMSLYPSRGLELHGFEVKVSRSDVLRELKEPEKAEELCTFCNRWWLVLSDASLIKPGELPPTWGLLVPRGEGLVAAVEAPKLEAQLLSRRFLAAFLRRAHDYYTGKEVLGPRLEEEVQRAVEAARVSWESGSTYRLTRAKDEAEELRQRIAAFERAAGVSIDRWNADEVGGAVRLVLDSGHAQVLLRLQRMRQELESLTGRFTQALASATPPATTPNGSTGDAT